MLTTLPSPFAVICCDHVGPAVISGCISSRRLTRAKEWPEIPQQRKSRPGPEPQAMQLLVLRAQNFGAEPGVSGCWPQLTPRWPFAKALSYLLSFLAGAAVGFKVSLTLWTLSRAVGPLPSDGLPAHHQTGRACCAESPDLELCRCCSDLCQDHPFSSSLDCDLAAMRSGRAGSCSTAPLPGSP